VKVECARGVIRPNAAKDRDRYVRGAPVERAPESALVIVAVVMTEVTIVRVIVVFVPQMEDELVQRDACSGYCLELADDLLDPDESATRGSGGGESNEPVVLVFGPSSRRVDVTLPCVAPAARLHTAVCLHSNNIPRCELNDWKTCLMLIHGG